MKVLVSAKMARLLFHGCTLEYIRDVCHSRCCDSSTSPTGTNIAVHPCEQKAIEAKGGVVISGLLQPRSGEKKCAFKSKEHLCSLHNTAAKPFGCIASPFTLNSNGTLIVRNRYRLLKCYRDGPNPQPAYRAFRGSLDMLFGKAEAARICELLDSGHGDIQAEMPRLSWSILTKNTAARAAAKGTLA